MHILALLISAVVAGLLFMNRIGRGPNEVADAAQTIANIPRRNRHRRAVNRRGLALVETPTEAATVLMLSIARMGEERRLSKPEREMIERHLVRNMRLDRDDADGTVRQMELVHDDVVLPETALFPMVDILLDTIDKGDARRLVDMMYGVADVHGRTQEQVEFVRRYRERMNLI